MEDIVAPHLMAERRPGPQAGPRLTRRQIDDRAFDIERLVRGIHRPGVRPEIWISPFHESRDYATVWRFHVLAILSTQEAVEQIAGNFLKRVGGTLFETLPVLKERLRDVHHESPGAFPRGVGEQYLNK